MKSILTLLLLTGLAGPVLAGTALKADLLNLSHKDAWVDLNASISGNKVKLDFKGPWANGSLIYDKKSSLLTVVDHLYKEVINLGYGSQTGIKIFLSLFSGQMKKQVSNSDNAAKRAFDMAQENAKALINGTPALVKKGARMNNFTCDEYATELEGKKAREIWTATPEKAGMNAEDFDTLAAMLRLAAELGSPLLDQFGADKKALLKNLSEPQLPVAARLYVMGKNSTRFKISSIKTKTFEDSVFSPPAGYKTLGLLDLMRQQDAGKP
jgi:hypothetical protein